MKLNIIFLSASLLFSSLLFSQVDISINNSTLKWEGKKITGSGHNGSLEFSDIDVKMNEGNIESGTFIVDMTSLTCDDLTGGGKSRLEGHLKADDFFGVETHKTASLVIDSVNNSKATGTLTIKGISHPTLFDLNKTQQGYNARLIFDRSKYDVQYASGSFFKDLGDKVILDEVEIIVELKF